MKLLLTNDDGYESIYLKAFYDYCSSKLIGHEVIVMAPRKNNSGVSQSITMGGKILYEQLNDSWYVVDGTPADCVIVGTSVFDDIDMVLSGPNAGSNLGQDVLYSGTVGAAREAVLKNLPAVAFSITDETNSALHAFKEERFYEFLDKWLIPFMNLAIDSKPELVNVNISNLKSLEVCEAPLATRHYYGFDQHVSVKDKDNVFCAMQTKEGVDDSRVVLGSDSEASLHDKTVYTVLSAWPQQSKGTLEKLQKYDSQSIKQNIR